MRGEGCRCEGGEGGSESALVMSGGTWRREGEGDRVNTGQAHMETRDTLSEWIH